MKIEIKYQDQSGFKKPIFELKGDAMDTIKIAREQSQRLIDGFKDTEWNCLTAYCINWVCDFCLFNSTGSKFPIHMIFNRENKK